MESGADNSSEKDTSTVTKEFRVTSIKFKEDFVVEGGEMDNTEERYGEME